MGLPRLLVAMALLGWAVVAPAQLQTGSSCVAGSGLQGTCTPLADCPSALEEVRAGGRPQICVFFATNPIVCCASSSDSSPHPPPNRTDGSIARAKCREYSKFVFTNEGSKFEDQCHQQRESLVEDGSVQPKEFPHMALLGFEKGSKDISWPCVGTLISPDFVMATATCAANPPSGQRLRWVRLGSVHSNVSDSADRPQVIAVAEAIVHPGYSKAESHDDLALLRLERPAEMNGHVRPACLHTEPIVPAVPATVRTGWGIWAGFPGIADDELVNTMTKMSMPIAEISKCIETFKDLFPIVAESQLCVEGKDRGLCTGDSGSPLQQATLEPYCMHKVVGVSQFDAALCSNGTPSVYSRVSHFVPWIEQVVWPQSPGKLVA